MTQTDTVFAGSIPAIYDRYVGPLLMEPYATDLARRLADIRSGQVLETAAGTGIVTRKLAQMLPAAVELITTDLNQPMIDFAAAQPGADRVTWRQADALALPFGDESFDAVVCQFGVMFFPDRVAAYREVLRVLKPTGRFVFNAWDRIEENEIAHIVTEALVAHFRDDSLRFFARTPHGYSDPDVARRELAQAGFSSVQTETVPHLSRAGSAREVAIGVCQGTPLRNAIEARDANALEAATDVAVNAIAARFGSGPISAKMQAYVITATAYLR
jgi:ubiquinone/menaquinone biosynthesis C-methylase UbiE